MDITVSQICQWMEEWADPAMAESYDNVGLLIGRPARRVKTLITALDATEAVIAYAVAKGAQMIVTHHPMPFRPVLRITDESRDGGRILSLAEHGIALPAAPTTWWPGGWGFWEFVRWWQSQNLAKEPVWGGSAYCQKP